MVGAVEAVDPQATNGRNGTAVAAKGELASPEARVLWLAASAERGSEHPLGEAIVGHAKAEGLALTDTTDFLAIPGHGIEATIDGARVVLGNLKLMRDRGYALDSLADRASALALAGKTPMFVAEDGVAIGIVAVADTLKPSSAQAVAALKALDSRSGCSPATTSALPRR